MAASQQPELVALCSVCVACSTLFVLLRLWSGHVQHGYKFGWDDFFAAATLPFIWGENALIFWWISLGLGKHAIDVPQENIAQSPKIIFAAAFLYDTCISLPKFSAIFFYHRIFEKTNRWFHRALWIAGFLNAGWLAGAWLSDLFQCTPVRKAWDESVEGHCIPQWNWFLGTALTSMIIDVYILIMPLPMLWRLQMSSLRKVMVSFVFVCGYAVVVVSIGRLVSLARAGSSLLDDITWGTLTYVKWVQCEGPVSLVSVCLPFVFNLIKGMQQHGAGYVLNGRHGQGLLTTAAKYGDDISSRSKSWVGFGDFKRGLHEADVWCEDLEHSISSSVDEQSRR